MEPVEVVIAKSKLRDTIKRFIGEPMKSFQSIIVRKTLFTQEE